MNRQGDRQQRDEEKREAARFLLIYVREDFERYAFTRDEAREVMIDLLNKVELLRVGDEL